MRSPRAAAAQQPLRTNQQESDQDREDERISIGPELDREDRLQRHRQNADHQAAHGRTHQAAHAADHGGDEGDKHQAHAHSRRKRPRLHHVEQRDDSGEHSAEEEGNRDHGIGPHAHETRHSEVLGGGAHLHADAAAAEEDDQPDEQHDGDGDGHHLKLRNAQTLDDEILAQLVEECDALGARAEDQENEVLEKIGERE